MIHRKIILLCLLMGLSFPSTVSFAQVTTERLPYKRHWAVYASTFYVSPSVYDYSGVAAEIVGDAETEYEMIKRLYLWVCDNVKYDTSCTIRTADGCWNTRTAVCQGYCELIYRMAKTLGIKVSLVNGKARISPSGNIGDHVWLMVRTEKGKILMDPTWGASAYRHAKYIPERDPLKWFDVAPEEMIKTHFPSRRKYELLTSY